MSDDAHRRLLDMLAGWAAYVEKCADGAAKGDLVSEVEYDREAIRIYDIYQEAGRMVSCPSERTLLAFIHGRVLPMIFDGRVPNESDAQEEKT